jgi:hypothetical protein
MEYLITMEWFIFKIICLVVLAERSGLIKRNILMDSLKMEDCMGVFVGKTIKVKDKKQSGKMGIL